MDALIAAIASQGGIAVLVLMANTLALVAALLKFLEFYKAERESDRAGRLLDAEKGAAATERQTDVVRECTKVLTALQITLASKQ